MKRKILVVFAMVVTLAASQLGSTTAEAAGVRVTFSVVGAQPGSSVLVLGSNVALKVPATAKKVTLSSRFLSSKTKRYAFSMHIINGDGTYGGPVVFKVKAKKASYTTNVVSRGSIALGRITVNAGGWAKSAKVLAAGTFGRLLRSPGADGKPRGAGMVGAVPTTGPLAASVGSRSGVRSLAVPCTKTDQTVGADCDADGVPNAIDADDNNNGVLDIADSRTSGYEAQKSLPWSTLYLKIGGSEKNLNANLDNVTTADIDTVMGGPSGLFSIAFIPNITTAEAEGYDAAWVDCGELSYCAKVGGTARTGPPNGNIGQAWSTLWCKVDLNPNGSCPEHYPWNEYTGSIFNSNNTGSKVTDSRVWNGLTRFRLDGETTWAGGMVPNVGTGLLDKVKIGDPYVINLRTRTGVVSQRPMALGAFFVTVPVVLTFASGGGPTTVDYTQATPKGSKDDPFVLDSNGQFSISFYRPQRPAIDGADPAGATFMDLGGLRYGLVLNGDGGDTSALMKANGTTGGFGCSSAAGGAYTAIPTDFARTPDNKGDTRYDFNVWPLTDSFTDATIDPGRTLSLTFDMKTCVQQIKAAPLNRRGTVSLATTNKVPIELMAAGIDLEGGASRASQTFWVQLPAGAASW